MEINTYQSDFNLITNFTEFKTLQTINFCAYGDGSLRGMQILTNGTNGGLNFFGNIEPNVKEFAPCTTWSPKPKQSISSVTAFWNSTQIVSLYFNLNDTTVKKFGSNMYAM
jgi:hypothetical protein